jgi:CRISPR/Cas system CSM-associated protein Csm3 (group 7 of RAMP superfamily)
MNPYDFVPIVEDKEPQKSRPVGHDKISGKSGLMDCKITTLKPFFIPRPMDEKERKKRKSIDPQEYILNTVNGVPVIPGSSIKGVIRSVAEAAANSCVSKFTGGYRYKHFGNKINVYYTLPNGFEECQYIEKLCITCRLFGFQSPEKSFQGKVNISDAKARNGYKNLGRVTLTELLGPKPHHAAFYALSPGSNRIAGRKFYFHHKQDAHILRSTKKPSHLNSTVNPIEDAAFDFKVSFTNLTDDEYKLLLYSLFLEDRVYHKLGYGKPAGLGSVRIEAEKLTLFDIDDIEKRYKKITADDRKEKSGKKLRDHIAEQTKIYCEDKSANLQALRRIWKWPGGYDICYPTLKDRNWFSNNPDTPLSGTVEK